MSIALETAVIDKARELLARQPVNVQAQYATALTGVEGDALRHRALMIIRQLGSHAPVPETHDIGEQPRRGNKTGTTASNYAAKPASEKAVKYLTSLLQTRLAPDARVPSTVKTASELLAGIEASGIAAKLASNLIDLLKDQPRVTVEHASRPAPAAPRQTAPAGQLEAGIYRIGDDWFKVQKAVHGSGNMYAKKLIVDAPGSGHFEYAPGAIRNIKPEHKVSLEEAKKFGNVYGVCCNCAATLTDEASIAAGIGPVCAKKF